MELYKPDPADPDWLARVYDFHGHRGPWVTVGAIIGRDALGRLETPGQWEVRVVCCIPADKQGPPFSCIIDGLQATCGATMGKQNIRVASEPAMIRHGLPTVYVVRRAKGNQPAGGCVYAAGDRLIELLSQVTPDRLDALSRRIARYGPEQLLDIRPMTAEEVTARQFG